MRFCWHHSSSSSIADFARKILSLSEINARQRWSRASSSVGQADKGFSNERSFAANRLRWSRDQ
jgi:hypothetical protein